MAKSIAERLAAVRKQRGLSLEQTASVIGVTMGTVRRWERGEGIPCSPSNRRSLEAFLLNPMP